MKNSTLHTYLFILFTYLIFSLNLTYAVTLSDNFEADDGGWQNHLGLVTPGGGVTTQVLELTNIQDNTKLYDFGVAVANTQVNIQFDIYGAGNWDSNDVVYYVDYETSNTTGAYLSFSFTNADGNTDPVVQHIDYNATTDIFGRVSLHIYPLPAGNSKITYLDNVVIKTFGTPPIMGNVPDETIAQYSQYSLDLSNYVTETDGDPIFSYSFSCPGLIGITFNSDTGLASGYPTSIGDFTCSLSATDKDGESNIDTFILTLTGTGDNKPPQITNIPDMSYLVTTNISIDLSTYVTPTDNDPIDKYNLTAITPSLLPTGLTFDENTGILSGTTPSTAIDISFSFYATDKDGKSDKEYFILHIVPTDTNIYGRDFTLRKQLTLPGIMYTIGNTILVAPTKQDKNVCKDYKDGDYQSTTLYANNYYELCSYWADRSNSVDFPTTQATLPSSLSGVNAKVKWAGLYWQALVEEDYPITSMQIQLKHSAADYITVDYEPSSLDYQIGAAQEGYLSYAAFSDVTSYFNDNNLTSGEIFVGDIPVVEGKVDELGTYGAWTLVIIYEDSAELLQNFSIYDGWQKVDKTNNLVDINISGFYTPKNAPSIDAQVSVFTAEGDQLINGDTLSVKPSKQATFTELIPNMNSAINTTPSFTRTPNPINNQGIDIQSFELGSTGKNIILPEETSMTLKFSSVGDVRYDPNAYDTYFPSMVAFSAQLYTPAICYDYTATIGDVIPIAPNDSRDINTGIFGGGLPLKIQFLIRSEEADFTYTDSKARITFSGADAALLNYNKKYSEMSPPKVNTYFTIATNPEIEANATLGQLNIGDNVIGTQGDVGGDLIANEITYAKLGYDFSISDVNQTTLSTQFDLHFDAKINFNPGDPGSVPVDYQFNTAANKGDINYISRCDTNVTYLPIQLGFNIERVDTRNEPLASKYTLWTQVVGRDYDVDIVAYTGGLNDPLTEPLDFKGTVELELINADAFQNDGTVGYDTTCQNPESIGAGTLIAFNPNGELNPGRHTVTPPSLDAYDKTRALRNAAFRLWVLATTDINGTKHVITHQCTDKTDASTCFKDLYFDTIDTNRTGACADNGTKPDCLSSNKDCYQCLKTYYATAVCSRDNFSIRPDSYSINISDGGGVYPDSSTPVSLAKNNNTASVRFSAGYYYKLDINTTAYNSNTLATGYFNEQYVAQRNLVSPPDKYSSGAVAVLEFTDRNNILCNDRNSSTIFLNFSDGTLVDNSYTEFTNVGPYELWLSDSNWTLVDHADYVNKPLFDTSVNAVDDCVLGSDTTVGKAGCAFHSNNGTHTLITAHVKPYRFYLDDIGVTSEPNNNNYTYFNDFEHPYYNDLLKQPIDTASVHFTGLLVAEGGGGRSGVARKGSRTIKQVSNFTDGCVAEDVILRTSIKTFPSDVNSTSPIQQLLRHTNAITNPVPVDQAKGYDQNLTLPKVAFPNVLTDGDITPGSARVILHTTLQKPKKSPSDPVIANYDAIYASSPKAWSNAGAPNYIPEGNNTSYDRNITYYFAKISSLETLYDNVIPANKITPLSVDIYCSALVDCGGTFNLLTNAVNGANNWYADTLYTGAIDGTTNLSVTTIFGTPAAPAINPNTDVAFIHTNATRTDVNVSVAGSARPTTVDIQIEAVPWFAYNPLDLVYGYPHYRVKFIGNSSWSGVGNTGNVVETTSNIDNINRMNW